MAWYSFRWLDLLAKEGKAKRKGKREKKRKDCNVNLWQGKTFNVNYWRQQWRWRWQWLDAREGNILPWFYQHSLWLPRHPWSGSDQCHKITIVHCCSCCSFFPFTLHCLPLQWRYEYLLYTGLFPFFRFREQIKQLHDDDFCFSSFF